MRSKCVRFTVQLVALAKYVSRRAMIAENTAQMEIENRSKNSFLVAIEERAVPVSMSCQTKRAWSNEKVNVNIVHQCVN